MLDNLKFRIENKTVINKLLLHNDFEIITSQVNNIVKYKHKKIGKKLRFELNKEFYKGKFIGYKSADVSISPHYHFNDYRHNGNDFTPENCIKSITSILNYLEIEPHEYNTLKVVNIEFGLNIIPETDIKNLINGLYFYRKSHFIIPNPKIPFNKISDTCEEKTIKAYAKGIQCHEALNAPEIDINTFRFEVKHKKSRPTISMFKTQTVTAIDLLDIENYKVFYQKLIDEWEQILLINLELKSNELNNLKKDQVLFIQNAKSFDFWNDLANKKHRNTFGSNKKKYCGFMKGKNNLHTEIKARIVDKLLEFSKCANSPERTPINKKNLHLDKTTPILIKCENAHFNKCLITGLDISMQKKGSKYLCLGGLKYYKENQPETYQKLTEKYLTEKQKEKSFDRQNYFIAHNIRNAKTNPNHNPIYSRQRFEKRNYNPNQLQFNF